MKKHGILKMILGICICLVLYRTQMCAAEQNYTANILVKTTTSASLYKQPDTASEIVEKVEANITLITKENQQGDWILVKHNEVEGYIKIQNISLFHAEGIEQEFEEKENTFTAFIQEVEYLLKEKRQKTIWGTTIVVLVVGIFAVGIVSSVISEKKKETKDK